MAAEQYVKTRTEDPLHFVTLSRPGKRNALHLDMLKQIADAVCAAEAQPGVRAVIVDAEGPVFSAGVDVPALALARAQCADQHPGRWLRRLAATMQHHLNRIEAAEVAVVGALNGKVIGLGLELALSFDLRVAAEDVRISIPETRLGLVADVGGTTRLSRIIGPSRAKDMLMTAREIGAEEALLWGLVNRVAPADHLAAAAAELARGIARNAPLAVGMAKKIIDEGDGLDRYTQMALERWAQSQLIVSEDVGEGMAAFFEKRPPEFQGK